MTPASPSDPSFLKVASTCIPIFTVAGSTSTICEVTRQPSSISTIARTYGFIISYAAGASWITENDTTVPFPFSFTRSIFPKLRRPHSGHTVLGGKSRVPQFPHFEPYRLYRLPISRQNLGIAISVHPPEQVDNSGRPRHADQSKRCVLEPPLSCEHSRIQRREVPPVMEGEEVGRLAGPDELHRGVRELPHADHRAKGDRPGPVAGGGGDEDR